MNIDVTLVANNGEVTAHAAVTRGSGLAQKGVSVRFNVDGTAKQPVVVNGAGHATLELGKLKIGVVHIVTAEVVSVSPPVIDVKRIKIDKKTRQPASNFERFMMIAYWLMMWWFFTPMLLTFTYLTLTMIVLFLISRVRGVSFGTIVSNNNWVFFATVAMAIATGIMGYFNPLLPDTVGTRMWESLKSSLGFEAQANMSDSIFWGIVNGWFFGESFTNGWNIAAPTYWVAAIPAFAVSFWDETFKFLMKLSAHLFKGEGLAKFALKDGLMELFWGIFKK